MRRRMCSCHAQYGAKGGTTNATRARHLGLRFARPNAIATCIVITSAKATTRSATTMESLMVRFRRHPSAVSGLRAVAVAFGERPRRRAASRPVVSERRDQHALRRRITAMIPREGPDSRIWSSTSRSEGSRTASSTRSPYSRSAGARSTTRRRRRMPLATSRRCPPKSCPLALFIEAARMARPLDGVDEPVFAARTHVVRNERRQRVDNVPYGNIDDIAIYLLFDGHAYGRPTVGIRRGYSSA